MSTILKALKQAEKNSPSFNVRTALNSRMQQRQQATFLSLGWKVMVVVIVMVIFSYSFFSINKTSQLQTTSADKQYQVLDTRPDTGDGQKPRPSKSAPDPAGVPKLSNEKGLNSETARQVGVGEIFPVKTIEKIPLPLDYNPLNRTKKSAPVTTAEAPETRPDDTSPFSRKEPSLNRLEMEDPVKDEKKGLHQDGPKKEIFPMENDDLRVQAISWAYDPESRIAVINNKVLGEGDSVQGYCLIRIEKDSVILHDSGKNYRLKIKYR
jgi:heme/copper-type cytochrome/quinol oxidase subunit 2